MNRSFFIAGVQFRPRDEIKEAIKKMEVGCKLIIETEPTNRFDPNAVRINYCEDPNAEGEFTFLGYVPKTFSAEVAGLLEAGVDLECIVEVVNSAAKPWEMCKVVVREAE